MENLIEPVTKPCYQTRSTQIGTGRYGTHEKKHLVSFDRIRDSRKLIYLNCDATMGCISVISSYITNICPPYSSIPVFWHLVDREMHIRVNTNNEKCKWICLSATLTKRWKSIISDHLCMDRNFKNSADLDNRHGPLSGALIHRGCTEWAVVLLLQFSFNAKSKSDLFAT